MSGWSNTEHITQSDLDEHQANINLRRLQERIYNLRKKREEPEVRTFYIDDQTDVVDILNAILDGRLDELERDDDEEDKFDR